MQSSPLLVNEVQRGNPLLGFIKNIKLAYSKEIVPDYAAGSVGVIFVTVKYHFRHPKVLILIFVRYYLTKVFLTHSKSTLFEE